MPEQPEGWGRLYMLSLVALWCVWFLWAVNWKKLGPVLTAGAWAPVLLLMVIVASAWSRLAPSSWPADGPLFDLVSIPNFWWQLGCVTFLVLIALFCGWLQGFFGWTPQEFDLAPPAHAHHHHGHGHDHGHEHALVEQHGHKHSH